MNGLKFSVIPQIQSGVIKANCVTVVLHHIIQNLKNNIQQLQVSLLN